MTKQKDKRCPRCKAGVEERVQSAGFGTPHDVCGKCGFEEFETQEAKHEGQ